MNSIRGGGQTKTTTPPFISPFIINFQLFSVNSTAPLGWFYLFQNSPRRQTVVNWGFERNQIMKIIFLSLQIHFQLVKLKVFAEDKSWPNLGEL